MPYGIGGVSKRAIQEKRKKLRDDFNDGLLDISWEELNKQLASIRATASAPPKPAMNNQPSISSMFSKALPQKHAHTVSVSSDDGIEEIPAPAAKRLKLNTASSSALPAPSFEEEEESSSAESEVPSSAESEIHEEVDISPEQLEIEARLENGDDSVDSIVVADEIAEWVETVLDDAAPLGHAQLGSLAADCLKIARKNKDYRSESYFAALVDFYRWMPRMGRLAAALRVSKNHGRGPAFQRVIAAQARFFEANGSLKPSHQGQREKSNGLLDDEGFYMGVQRWLRTLEVGTVSHHEGGY